MDLYGFSIARSRLQAAVPLRRILSPAAPPACLWQSLLELLSSLSHLVPGGRLRMSSLRICLHRSRDRLDPSAPVPWSLDCLRDLRWWLRGDRFSRGVSLLQVCPVLAFWSGASDVGLGPHLGDRVVSGLWNQSEAFLPVHARELLAVRHGLLHFQSFLSGTTVAVFWVPYLLKGGGGPVSCSRHRCPVVPPLGGISSDSTGSAVPSGDPQCSCRLSLPSSPASQFRKVSQLGHISIFAASVAGDVRPVCHFWPSLLLHLFSPYRDPLSAGTDALLQSWDGLLACAFPPWSVLPRVLVKLRVSHRTLLTLIVQYWPQRPWFVDLLQLSLAPPVPLSARPDLLFQPRFRRRYPELHRLALHAWGLSSASPGGWFLLSGGCAGFVGAPSFIALHLPAQVVGFPVMVPLSGPLHLAAIPLQGSGFPLVASIGSGP